MSTVTFETQCWENDYEYIFTGDRLKQEIAKSVLPEDELFSKNLRLEELTAIIDGYSGGYFSKKVKELNEE